jgi:hypothetical protein
MIVMLLSHQLLLMAAIPVVLWSDGIRGPDSAERVAHPAQAGALLPLWPVERRTARRRGRE